MSEEQKKLQAEKVIKDNFKKYLEEVGDYDLPSFEEFCIKYNYASIIDKLKGASFLGEEFAILDLKTKLFLRKKRLNSKEGLEEEMSSMSADDSNLMIVRIEGVGIRKDIHRMIEDERRRRKANKK